MINLDNLQACFKSFKNAIPFDYCIVDNFFQPEWADVLASEFLEYESPKWFYYKNKIEDKKALNDWNVFPQNTYYAFDFLLSKKVVQVLSESIGMQLYVDHGLHGGGWHIHGTGGNLNPHLDYSIHPKLGLQRKLNIIIYLSKELNPLIHGGQLGLWSNDLNTNQPAQLVKEVDPVFNRAVIFDTTQMSWHGMSRPLTQPEGIYRKSFAIYYLCEPAQGASKVERALFAPRENQKNDPEIKRVIELRSGVETSRLVYRDGGEMGDV